MGLSAWPARFTPMRPSAWSARPRSLQGGGAGFGGPGDSVVLANGVWRDFEMVFTGEGTAARPITLRAQTAGKVVISGKSNLRIAGRHLVVSGLTFKDGFSPSSEVIAFRQDSKALAFDSRVTETVIDGFNKPDRAADDYWIGLYGQNNRVDHNHLQGKLNNGVTLAVVLSSAESQQNNHRIDHNYFGPRPPLGSNGGETIRSRDQPVLAHPLPDRGRGQLFRELQRRGRDRLEQVRRQCLSPQRLRPLARLAGAAPRRWATWSRTTSSWAAAWPIPAACA
jgi:hypothetical protein